MNETIIKMKESAKKVFGARFVRFGQNIHNEELGYAAIDGTVFGSDFKYIESNGFKIISIEGTAKKSLIVHFREKEENEN